MMMMAAAATHTRPYLNPDRVQLRERSIGSLLVQQRGHAFRGESRTSNLASKGNPFRGGFFESCPRMG